MADRLLFPHVRTARLLVGKWYRFTLAFPDLGPQPPPAERFPRMHQWTRGHWPRKPGRRAQMRTRAPDTGCRLPAVRWEFPWRHDLDCCCRPGADAAAYAVCFASAHASAECSLQFTPAKMIGVPNPYLQLINLDSRPGKARFTAKAVNTNSNREIPPIIRKVTEIKPDILRRW